ncbi:low molecular weight protein-tyrosine-phosphatase [methane-oxidizing endosymbiont of Gigantopelta aegis]|uniref:low molecular weight protein-tyrosine-phosphatase n=1 Tax=methane-oxidizing endosymbiont of Gigantopelta aegis TaxID=2794938 RepID=UPI00247AC9BE|nr:low molecular weight protein-tyrosine-phosphatase [methane-oxidizing endosymbiont of Gigantopelta aegis]
MSEERIKVLFVCMGNICRSPTAEGVFRALVEQRQLQHLFHIDSAGTHAFHVGEEPDPRAQKAAGERDYDLSGIRARKVIYGDFEDFDHILAMDNENFAILTEACPEEHLHKVQYFMDFAPHVGERDVPDPYYGGSYGFERVLDMVEEASIGFINHILEKHSHEK